VASATILSQAGRRSRRPFPSGKVSFICCAKTWRGLCDCGGEFDQRSRGEHLPELPNRRTGDPSGRRTLWGAELFGRSGSPSVRRFDLSGRAVRGYSLRGWARQRTDIGWPRLSKAATQRNAGRACWMCWRGPMPDTRGRWPQVSRQPCMSSPPFAGWPRSCRGGFRRGQLPANGSRNTASTETATSMDSSRSTSPTPALTASQRPSGPRRTSSSRR
jgi:hypothetical protein